MPPIWSSLSRHRPSPIRVETAVSLFIGRMSHGIVLGDFCDVIVKHHAAIEFATCRAVPDDVMGDFIEQLAKQRHMIGANVFHESIVVQREPSMESLAGKLFSKSVT